MSASRRPMRRVGDLLPDAARALGLEEELRLGRAAAAFAAVLARIAPGMEDAARLVRISGRAIIVEVDHPIVGQEVTLRSTEILEALAVADGGLRADELRTVGRRS